ncbi:MAG: acetoacetate--CoA ligase [Pseudomonadota bacterium]
MSQSQLWKPSPARIEASQMTAFMAAVSRERAEPIETYEALHRWSLDDKVGFWNAVWDFAGLVGDKGALPHLINAEAMPGARFFPHAQINVAENLLRRTGDHPALIFQGEAAADRRELSWDALRAQTACMARYCDHAGLEPGERIAAVMPNLPETMVAMLGGVARGAVVSTCSPDFGPQGILDRFGQIAPKVLIVCDGYRYNGKAIDITAKVVEVVRALPSVQRVVVVPYLDAEGDGAAADVIREGLTAGEEPRADVQVETWADVMGPPGDAPPLTFKRMPGTHPLYILFSSGTTGAPKCIVHSGLGTLLKHASELHLHVDAGPDDRLFYFTTCGWMMWNWLASGLMTGATLVLYDGAPGYPDMNRLFALAERERVSVFGTSAKFIDALNKADVQPGQAHDLSALRAVLSTGSTLVPEGFDYIYRAVKADVHLASMSGGTDLIGCFVTGNPLLPVYRGEIQSAALGMSVQVYDDAGERAASGRGELVCDAAFPSMPLGFWNDEGDRRYRAAYFSRFDNVWHHGDFAEWTDTGGMLIHGRSDATLNPGGVRIGTAEIYRQVETLAPIKEAIVIGQAWDGDTRVVLFVVMQEGEALDADLEAIIRQQIRQGASPRHVPSKIIAVADIPRTKSGKITELAVRDVVHGRAVKNKEALANPEALAHFQNLAALSS